MRSISEYKDGVEESVTSVNCVVCVSEVKNEPEQVSHDNDALFRTPTVGPVSMQVLFFLNHQFLRKYQCNNEI